jgi:hypothetical protein
MAVGDGIHDAISGSAVRGDRRAVGARGLIAIIAYASSTATDHGVDQNKEAAMADRLRWADCTEPAGYCARAQMWPRGD